MQLIVTHAGNAHFDEVTAISLLLAVDTDGEFRVERRDPSVAELEDPAVWVIDTGNRYEPEKRNFDHHQSLDCPASFVLAARYLGLEQTLSVMPWWRFKDSVDRIGPARSSAIFGAGDDLINRNPVEDWLTDVFSSVPQDSLPLLRSFGIFLIENARKLKYQIDFWKSARRISIAGITAAIGETRESYGLEEFRRLCESPPDIIISLDRQGNGWRLFRYEGTPVDFTLISDCPEVEFAHKSGFLAKTRERLPLEALIGLLSKTVVQR
ncbi:MAG: MYG1 family protein [Dehalococcoidales bacterium]|nr:MYG1 family protein [Dehalococcoidales bacterium]